MSDQQEKIYFGFSPDYEDHPTLVFWGSPSAFATFSRWIKDVSQSGKESIRLGELPFFTHGKMDIVLQLSAKATGMKKTDEHSLEWGLSAKECELFAEHLRGLSLSPVDETRWQFLDCDTIDEVEVVATVGEEEYPKAAFQ